MSEKHREDYFSCLTNYVTAITAGVSKTDKK